MMGIEVIIAIAILSAGFVIVVSLWAHWYWNFRNNFREWLDQKLTSTLKEKVLSELTNEGNIVVADQNALFSWLYIAWWCVNKTEATYTNLFSYRLANGKTLAEFLLDESNNPENSKLTQHQALTQQTCIQNLVLLWHTQRLKTDKTVSSKDDKLPEKYTPQEQLELNPLSALLHKPLNIDFSIQEIPQHKLCP